MVSSTQIRIESFLSSVGIRFKVILVNKVMILEIFILVREQE